MKKRNQRHGLLAGLLAALLLISSALACEGPTYTPSPPQATAGALNSTYEAESTVTRTLTPGIVRRTITPTPSATPEPTLTPTVTLTPWRPIEVTPCGAAICEVPDTDENILSRLCVVEVRGFGSARRAACLSVISTVFKRIRTGEYSDGSVSGTILYGCTPEHGCQHFPGFVVNGCEGIVAEACPWNYPDDIAYFAAVARDALNGDWEAGSAVCLGYTYYGSRDIDERIDACVVEADNGLKEWFYN